MPTNNPIANRPKVRITLSDSHGIITPFNVLVMFLWSYNAIIYFVNLFLRRFSAVGGFLTTVFLVLLVIMSLSEIRKKVRIRDLFFYFGVIAIFILQYVFYPQNERVLDGYFNSFLFGVVPFFFLGLFIDIKEQKGFLFWVSLVAVFVQVLYHLWYRPRMGMDSSSEDMIGAYQIAPHVGFLFWTAFDRKKILYYLVSILSFLFLISMGNRGSVVCISVFIIFALLFLIPYKRPILSRLIIIIVGVLFLAYLNNFIDYFIGLFMEQGMSIRVLSLLERDEFASSESREWITRTLLDAVKQGPVLGFGIAGDRSFDGILYAHNFVVELFVAFGFFVGAIILIAFVLYILMAFSRARSNEEKLFLLLLVCCFMKLMMSGTYLEDYDVWILLGYCANIIRGHRESFYLTDNM